MLLSGTRRFHASSSSQDEDRDQDRGRGQRDQQGPHAAETVAEEEEHRLPPGVGRADDEAVPTCAAGMPDNGVGPRRGVEIGVPG